jgi:hypothetical protein
VCSHHQWIAIADSDWLNQKQPKLKKWKKKAFPLYDEMFDLIEGTYVTGNGAFRAGRDFTPHTESSKLETEGESPPKPASGVIDPRLLEQSQAQNFLIWQL